MTSEDKADLVITRIIDAPRELVWKAWTEPEQLKRWWGPKDFTAPVWKADLRVGGEYLNSMRATDGKDSWGKGIFREIVPPERLVMTDSFADHLGNVVPASYYGMSKDFSLEMQIRVLFEEDGDRTKITLQHTGIPAGADREGAKQGWSESFDKLERYLGGEKSGLQAAERSDTSGKNAPTFEFPSDREVVITRYFDAPRDQVYRASTDPRSIPQWWGPERYTTTVEKMDVRPGGEWRFIQRDQDGNEYAFKGIYREVMPPERESHTFEFEGMPGHVIVETSEFEDLGGRTKLTITELFQSKEDRDGMFRSGMKEGSTESTKRLERLLKKEKT